MSCLHKVILFITTENDNDLSNKIDRFVEGKIFLFRPLLQNQTD